MQCIHFAKARTALLLFLVGTSVLVLALLFISRPAAALPSFAQQLDVPCSQCHVQAFGPALTPFGRLFKLNGYVWSAPNPTFPPLDMMIQGPSYTHTDKGQPGGAAEHFADNNNVTLDQFSLLYGGRTLVPNLGAFIQGTYNGVDRNWALDNTDIRYANQGTVAGNAVVYGVSLNNNPTVQDLWNTTPVWSFPPASSLLAPTPAAATLIDGGLAQQVLGATIYTMWNDLLYVEAGPYFSLSNDVQGLLGVQYQGCNRRHPSFRCRSLSGEGYQGGDHIDNVAPYWRVALQRTQNDHNFSIGTYGFYANIFPEDDRSAGTDQYTDIGFDTSYQYLGSSEHIFTFNSTFIMEFQNLSASQALGNADKSYHTLNTFRADASYIFKQTYGLTLGYFQTTGTTDTLLYQPSPIFGSASGSPNSRGYIVQLDYIPFGKAGSFLAPWLNVRFSLQYTGYTEFNGGHSNYDGFGRNASNNNTLYLLSWFAF